MNRNQILKKCDFTFSKILMHLTPLLYSIRTIRQAVRDWLECVVRRLSNISAIYRRVWNYVYTWGNLYLREYSIYDCIVRDWLESVLRRISNISVIYRRLWNYVFTWNNLQYGTIFNLWLAFELKHTRKHTFCKIYTLVIFIAQ